MGIIFVVSLLIFSGFGIFSHPSTPSESECLFSVAESANCSTGESQSLHVIKHCLNFFVGVMQTSEGLEKSLLVLLVVTGTLFKRGTFKEISFAITRTKHYVSRSVILKHYLVSAFRSIASWSAFAYSYSH